MKRIVLAGGSGFLGRILATHFQKAGYVITILSRKPHITADNSVQGVIWDARTLEGWASELDGAHAVINLTGRSVNCRYHAANRQLIMDSRVHSTEVIGQAIAKCKAPPLVWLNASTATIYKHTFGPAWDESGDIMPVPEAKDEFSIKVATAWEQALSKAQTPKTRKIALRAAMVLGKDRNSVFPMLRRLAKWGLGGKMGHGRQFVSWINETDFCRAVEWLITHEQLNGATNLAAPNPITNEEMMRTFRKVVGMPIGLPASKWMLEIGAFVLRTETELIIKSRRVIPRRLLESGFIFDYPELAGAIANLQTKWED